MAIPYPTAVLDTKISSTLTQDRQRAVGPLEAGQLLQEVAIPLGVHTFTIYRLQNRFHTANTTDDLPGSGRLRVTTAEQDRYIL